MELKTLLAEEEIDPSHTMVMRHRPWEPGLEGKLRAWASERQDLFNCYQSTHGARVEKALGNATHLVSTVALGPGKAVLVGIYRNRGSKPITLAQYWEMPAHQEMKRFGMKGFTGEDGRKTIQLFDLEQTDRLSKWSGKLVIEWPGIERSWWRWADRNKFAVHAIFDESQLVLKLPDWEDLVLRWEELESLPSLWRAALQQWCGIYRIYDSSDRRAYVGSAYGKDNLLGRWMNYAATGHGGNKLLRKRNPENFTFSILQLVSPTADERQVINLESSWKKRLQTRAPDGLNDN